jgi:hypothetical protein
MIARARKVGPKSNENGLTSKAYPQRVRIDSDIEAIRRYGRLLDSQAGLEGFGEG